VSFVSFVFCAPFVSLLSTERHGRFEARRPAHGPVQRGRACGPDPPVRGLAGGPSGRAAVDSEPL